MNTARRPIKARDTRWAAHVASWHFCGPMAKQHRMAVMTCACLASAVLGWCGVQWPVVPGALVLIGVGSLITVFRRVARVVRELEGK